MQAFLADLWDKVLGPDPGWLRLRFAARVALPVTLTVLSLIAINLWDHLPIGAIALGFMIAQFSGAAVRDPTPRGQLVTILLMPLPALAAVTLAILLAPWEIASDLGFIAVVFAAAQGRGFGPRGMAFGALVADLDAVLDALSNGGRLPESAATRRDHGAVPGSPALHVLTHLHEAVRRFVRQLQTVAPGR